MDKNTLYMEISSRLSIDINSISDELNLKDDLKVDSLDLVEIVMDIEDEYGISISNDQAVNIKTVGDLFDIVVGE